MTREAKRVIDEAKAKSDRRKSDFGVPEDAAELREHRKLPDRLTKKVNEAYMKVSEPTFVTKKTPAPMSHPSAK